MNLPSKNSSYAPSHTVAAGFKNTAHFFHTTAEKLQVHQPKWLLSIFPSEKNEFDTLQLNPQHVRIHIGKMTKTNDNLYTTEMMTWLISSLVPYLKHHSDRITIVLWTQMADALLDDASKQTMLSLEQQILLLHGLFKKNFPKHYQHIDLIDVSTLHPEVFDILQNNTSSTEIAPLDQDECPTLPQVAHSQDILRYLYWCAQHCPRFFEDLQKTKTEQHREHTKETGPHTSDYYALVEVALRITDYLNWVRLHGGMKRQEVFDTIIRNLLFKNTYGSTSPQLQTFFERAQSHLPTKNDAVLPFKGIYFNNLKYAEYLQKLEEKHRIIRSTLTVVATIAITLTSVLGVYHRQLYQDKKKLQAQIDRMIDNALSKTDVEFYLNQRPLYTKDKNIKESIISIATYYTQRIYAEYGNGDIPQEELLLMVLNDLITTQPDLKFGDVGYNLDYCDHVATFFEHHAAYLIAKWFSARPYEQRASHEDAFARTLDQAYVHEYTWHQNLYKTSTKDDDERQDLPPADRRDIDLSHIHKLWSFGTYANIWLISDKHWVPTIAAQHVDDNITPSSWYSRSLWESVAKEYFCKRYPGSVSIANAIFFRYIADHVSSSELWEFKTLLQLKILKIGNENDLLQNTYFMDPSVKIEDVIIDTLFMPQLSELFNQFGYHTTPYSRYLAAYTAITNTATAKDMPDDLLSLTRKDHDTYHTTSLWYYTGTNSIRYQLATIEYNAEPYLLAKQLPSPPVSTYESYEFGYVAWRDVAKELLSIRASRTPAKGSPLEEM